MNQKKEYKNCNNKKLINIREACIPVLDPRVLYCSNYRAGMIFDKKYGKTNCRTKNKDNQNESS